MTQDAMIWSSCWNVIATVIALRGD
jgi:hypothetical protein